MCSPTRFITRGFLLGGLLMLGGCFDEYLESNDAVATAAARKVKADYTYTTDLSPWGPHPETSLKLFVTEPRFMALSHAERGKVNACTSGKHQAVHIMTMLAGEEYLIDTGVRGAIKNGGVRVDPVGKLAQELFRKEIQIGSFRKQTWPPENLHGREIASMYGMHFGYQFWEEDYRDLLAKGPLSNNRKTEELSRKIFEQFWPLCLERVPTACFEKGSAHPEHCLAHLIHPREFPGYEENADLFTKKMRKPNGW